MNKNREWTGVYPVNMRLAKSIVDNDREMLMELFEIFLEHLPEQLEQIEASVSSKDGERMQFYAHQLKGAMRNFAAEEACKKAYALEKAGKYGDFENIDEIFRELRTETSIVKKYIEEDAWSKYF